MESRKVQRVGLSTLSVSLPSDWVKEVNLKQGDLIFITQEGDGSLKLNAKPERQVKVEDFVINSDLCNEPEMLERLIVGNYVIGRDTLRLVASKRIRREHVEETRGITRRLIGMSIIEETPSQIVLLCSIDPEKFKMNMLIRRLSIIALTMFDEAIKAVIELDPNLAKDVVSREDEANAIYWLIVRLLHSAQRVRIVAEKIELKEPLQIPDDRLISKCIEKIADCAEYMAKKAITLKEHKGKIFVENESIEKLSYLFELARYIFVKSIDCIFTGDVKDANSALEMKETFDKEEERLLPDLPAHLSFIALGLSRIAENGATISAIAVNRALEKPSDLCKPY